MSQESDFYFPAPRLQKFCSQCATPITRKAPPGDNRERDLCEHCGAVHYQNPRLVVGTLPVWEGKVLLCLRAIEPRANTWTLPAGFMELAETMSEGAERETQEEAGVGIKLGMLYTVIDIPQVDQVHVYFLAKATGPDMDPGPETIEARWYELDEIPWDNLAFKSVSTTLKHYIDDLKTGDFQTHHYSLSNPHRP
ncbi:NUDIX hydrolase [Orrella sp. NBD-18]|uniref:NUDIX hydrolase n=1 Tax=Sheuella amnicola TaxID=2707330 RepID=A0A6B2R5Z1_9BURK|nr:NUDIX hydrolase [Sheuella amnicola]NDY84457.1 NUDIX hydrolase [Sheuella amnicola]HBI83634.1 NUDIX hydrolase [Alcaligenaceae bacterium]